MHMKERKCSVLRVQIPRIYCHESSHLSRQFLIGTMAYTLFSYTGMKEGHLGGQLLMGTLTYTLFSCKNHRTDK